MMDGAIGLTVAMIVMMGGMARDAGWALIRRQHRRDR